MKKLLSMTDIKSREGYLHKQKQRMHKKGRQRQTKENEKIYRGKEMSRRIYR